MSDSIDNGVSEFLDRIFNHLCGLGEELFAYAISPVPPLYYFIRLLLFPLQATLFILGMKIDFHYYEKPKPILQRLMPGILKGPWLFIFLLPLLLVNTFQDRLLIIYLIPLSLLFVWFFWAILFKVPINAFSAQGSFALSITVVSLFLLILFYQPVSTFVFNVLNSLFSSDPIAKHHTSVTFLILLSIFSYLVFRILFGKETLDVNQDIITSKGLTNPIVANAFAIGTFLIAKNTLSSTISISVINSIFVRAIFGILFESLALISVRMVALVKKKYNSNLQLLDVNGKAYSKPQKLSRGEKIAVLFSLSSWFCVIWLIIDIVLVWLSQ